MKTNKQNELVMFSLTHVFQGDDVGMLAVSQQDLHLL